METDAQLKAEHAELRRVQRKAFNAWQAAPAGSGDTQLRNYEQASRRLAAFNARCADRSY